MNEWVGRLEILEAEWAKSFIFSLGISLKLYSFRAHVLSMPALLDPSPYFISYHRLRLVHSAHIYVSSIFKFGSRCCYTVDDCPGLRLGDLMPPSMGQQRPAEHRQTVRNGGH